MNVLKESLWSVDVERTISGLRDAADQLANAGVPSDAVLTVGTQVGTGKWMHVEARYLYDDDLDEEEAPEPEPSLKGSRP